VINPPQQRRTPAKVGIDSVGSSGIEVGRHGGLLHFGIVPPELADDLAAAERFVQLADALLKHGSYSHDHMCVILIDRPHQ
jgi:hypothetical protein